VIQNWKKRKMSIEEKGVVQNGKKEIAVQIGKKIL
jgi:hypothetical protein